MIFLIILTTCAMALYTNRTFALAPGLGSVGIVAAMISSEGISAPVAAGVIFWSGVLFIAISSPGVIVAIIGFVVILVIKTRNIPGGMILAILITTVIGIPFGVTELPSSFLSLPTGIGSQFMQIDFLGALHFAYIPFLIALFIPDFFSTFGTVLGNMRKIHYEDITEAVPAFVCIAFTIFANNIANGICAAIPAYFIMKIAAGKIKELSPVTYIMVAVCLLYFYTLI